MATKKKPTGRKQAGARKAKARAGAKGKAKKTKAKAPPKKAAAAKRAKPRAAAAKAKPRAAAKAKPRAVAKRPAAKAPARPRRAAPPRELAEITMPSPPPSVLPVRSTTTLVQTVELPALPGEVYRAYLDSATHARFTGGGAQIDARVGGRFTAWDGYIAGSTLELVEGERIVQAWRTSEWPEGYDDSRLEITLAPAAEGSGTKLTMVHEGVPSAQAKALEQGWIDHYWTPLRRYLAGDPTTSDLPVTG